MPLKNFRKKKKLPSIFFNQRFSEINVTPLGQESPKHLPSHLYTPTPTNVKELKPKAAQAADLTLNTHPYLSWGKKNWIEQQLGSDFLFTLLKKRIAFKSAPFSDLELLVQVTLEVSMFYPRITNIIREIIPKFFIMFSNLNTSSPRGASNSPAANSLHKHACWALLKHCF